MRPALESPTVRLITKADVGTIAASDDGSTIKHLDVAHGSRKIQVSATRYVVAAGAVNTAVLLLRSRTRRRPDGIANSSGMVGRNYMAHPTTFVVGVLPTRANRLVFQKTLGINDWYHAGPSTEFPLGNVQALGKLQGWTIKSQRRAIPHGVLEWTTQRSVDFLAETEDLPLPESRVTVDDIGRVHLNRVASNLASHHDLVRRTAHAIQKCGYPFIFTQRLPWAASSHQCGTATMGVDPARSVLTGLQGTRHRELVDRRLLGVPLLGGGQSSADGCRQRVARGQRGRPHRIGRLPKQPTGPRWLGSATPRTSHRVVRGARQPALRP
jgi:choline dehydrogenase-like flavoprotein